MSPVIIFLSDGECDVSDATVRSNSLRLTSHRKPLSLHTVSFEPSNETLRRMAQISRELEATAPSDPLLPPMSSPPMQLHHLIPQVRLAETFLGLANSPRKTRGSLIR
ncbi:hypothetical protein BJ322DRAFT_995977 [Thelephora terrestris]|uniref:Uncharacterized protein n=1 Tax=Thelephora terrestris TaxID=56493 RepID=A0A9P6HP38_9AGAM|nr:hypothetical protein BJ322DRAFT_995977 [Thelephora terrestris]